MPDSNDTPPAAAGSPVDSAIDTDTDTGTDIGSRELFTWVKVGLLRYQQQGPVEHDDEIAVLKQQLATALTGFDQMRWSEIDLLLAEHLMQVGGGLSALVVDPARDLPQLFLFTLCSAIELDRDAARALARVQGIGRPGWLQIGTATAVLDFLFPRADPLDISDCRLARERLLLFDGPGPAVLQHVYTSGDHWKALQSGQLLSEFEPIEAPADGASGGLAPAELVAHAAALLRGGNGVALQTDHHSARGLVAQVAAVLQRRAVAISQSDWQQRSVRAVARYADWLPLVDCLRADAGVTAAAGIDGQSVLLVRSDQALPDRHIRLTLPSADSEARRQWWRSWIGDHPALLPLASAKLSYAAIERIGRQLPQPDAAQLPRRIRQVRTADGSAHLRRVALPVDTHIDDAMLVLPSSTQDALERCYQRCLQREYQHLGMGATIRATASNGVVLLFSGASGTGKTLASAWLASRLAAPLYRIDLAMVMNKYVGETEKNLSLALDEAARDDVILLFDEADALFGKRSEGSHGGDRFANMLTNFLLSRIETHSGIVVLTTNAGNRMDSAFVRRIDIAVEFLAPRFAERLLLWQRLLAGRAPAPGPLRRIARHCELSPGHVRNIVVNACCWYPEQTPLTVAVLWQALDEEYRKAGRSMPSQLMALKEPGADATDIDA